ncbi:unnamed protein product [Cochlearia groenlandica]
MGMKEQQNCTSQRKIIVFIVISFLPIALFLRLCFSNPLSTIDDTSLQDSTSHFVITSYSSSSTSQENETQQSFDRIKEESLCDYTKGKWIRDEIGPLYNGSSCETIKDGQNCFRHGRPDFGYLFLKWKPNQCDIPRFDPNRFLDLMKNKHIAFIGDSMARNQLESLICMLSTVSSPELVYRNGEDNKFRKWRFGSHNVTVSVYWSPFLVAGTEKSEKLDHNILYLDRVDERWGDDLDRIDTVVVSVGHWFLHPAVYIESGSVLGCHSCESSNYTEIGFFDVFRKAIRTTLKAAVGSRREVILTTFSPSHFEGRPWDSLGACNMTEPYQEEDKVLEGLDLEMRRIEMEEVTAAKAAAEEEEEVVRLEALDVTEISVMRRDGHPGPYMYKDPFKNGVPERVHNDCLHWCLPGPVDTWNEIMIEMLRRWKV